MAKSRMVCFLVGERRFLFVGESGGEHRFCSTKVGLRLAHLLAHLVNQARLELEPVKWALKIRMFNNKKEM